MKNFTEEELECFNRTKAIMKEIAVGDFVVIRRNFSKNDRDDGIVTKIDYFCSSRNLYDPICESCTGKVGIDNNRPRCIISASGECLIVEFNKMFLEEKEMEL